LFADSWVDVRADGTDTLVRIRGDLDAPCVRSLEAVWGQQVAPSTSCRVDLKELGFCGVAGARALAALTDAHAGPIAVSDAGVHVERVLKMVRLRLPFDDRRTAATPPIGAATINVLDEALAEAMRLGDADMGNAQLRFGDDMRIVAQRGFHPPFLDFFRIVHHDEFGCGSQVRAGQLIAVDDVATSPVFRGSPALEVMLDAGVRSMLSMPVVAEGGVVAVFSVHRRHVTRWDPAVRAPLEELATATARRLMAAAPPAGDLSAQLVGGAVDG
jgi:GAF domain-containing protein